MTKKKCKLCGPLPGLLFPVNDSPEVQRCDECGIYTDDVEAGKALFDFLKREGRIMIRVKGAKAAYYEPAEIALSVGAELSGHARLVLLRGDNSGVELDLMLYETGWMTTVYRNVQDALKREKARARKARSIISLVTVHHDEASTRADVARQKYEKLARVIPRVVRAAGLQTTVYVVVETEKEK